MLEKARKSKLGQVVKGASIYVEKKEKKYELQDADRDYRYLDQKFRTKKKLRFKSILFILDIFIQIFYQILYIITVIRY